MNRDSETGSKTMSNTGDLPKYVQISELLAIPDLCMLAESARCQEKISAIEPVLACAAQGDAGRPSLARGIVPAEQQRPLQVRP